MSDDMSMHPVERAIRQAMADGLFDNLPGTGKPLKWRYQEESVTPREMRMANKILQDNDLTPSWMMLGDGLKRQHEKILSELERGIKAYTGALQDAERSGDLSRYSRVNKTWASLLATFREAAESYNRNVMTYNLTIPPGIPQRSLLDIDQEIARWQKG